MKRPWVAWRMPDRAWRIAKRKAMRQLIWMCLRISIVAAVSTAAGIYVLRSYAPVAPPPGMEHLFVLVGAGCTVFWWLAPIRLYFQRHAPEHALSRTEILPGKERSRRLAAYTAFDLHPCADSPADTELRLYTLDGQQSAIPLPGDERDELIVRIIGRVVRPLEDHPNREWLLMPQVRPPAWVTLTLFVIGVLWATAVNSAAAHTDNKDLAEMVMLGHFVSPLWLMVWVLRHRARARRYNRTIRGWAIAAWMIGVLLGLPIALMSRP